MKLRFTPRATKDLSDIAKYIRDRNPEAARRGRAAILASLRQLKLFPNAGRQQKIEGVRKLVTQRYPYLVYYTIDESNGEVVVITIQHPAQERNIPDA